MPIAAPTAGNRIVTSDLAAFYNLLKGVAGSGENITLIYNAAGSVILQPSSDPAADTQAIQIKNNAGTVQSALTFDGNAVLKTKLTLAAAVSKIIPGVTSLSLRNNADNADNIIITDAGVVTVRAGLTLTSGNLTFAGAGTIAATGQVILQPTTSVSFNYPKVALGGGAAPTLGTIGGSGPGTATQNSWLRIIADSGNITAFIPLWI